MGGPGFATCTILWMRKGLTFNYSEPSIKNEDSVFNAPGLVKLMAVEIKKKISFNSFGV